MSTRMPIGSLRVRIALAVGVVVLGVCAGTTILRVIDGRAQIYGIVRGLPNDTSVYYYRNRGRHNHVIALDIQSGRKNVLGAVPGLTYIQDKLPDNKGWLAWSYLEPARSQLAVYSPDFKTSVPLMTSPFSDMFPSLSQDGVNVYFLRAHRARTDAWGGPQWTDWDVYRGNISGASPTRLTRLSSYDISAPSESADGKSAVFSVRLSQHSPQLYVLDVLTGKPRLFLPSSGYDTEPVYSDDGRRIAFISTRSEPYKYEVWIVDATGGRMRQVTQLRRRCTDPVFIGGGSMIAFIVDETELWKVNTDGTGLARLD